MRANLTAILIDNGRWSAGLVRAGEPVVLEVIPDRSEDAAAQATALVELLGRERIRFRRRPSVLVVPGAWCLAAPVATDGLMRRGRRTALGYRLEDQLPLDAEQLSADFLEAAGQALGVAIETRRLESVLAALDEQSIPIACICPLELLTLQHVQSDPAAAGMDEALCLIQHDDHLNLVAPLDRPKAWRQFPAEAGDLQRHLRRQRLAADEPLTLVAAGLDPHLAETVQSADDCGRLEVLGGPAVLERAVLAAEAVAKQGRNALINLRRDALAAPDRLQQVRGPLLATLWALALLLAALGGALQWQAYHHRQVAHALHAHQQAHYHDAFPGRDVPLAVLANLRSEAERLRGMSGASDQLPERASALHLLPAILQRLPNELRYRVLELRLDGQRLYLDGQARSHSGADAVAAGLRQDRIFDIEPPRTEGLPERGVSFTLTGRPRTLAPAAGEPDATGDDQGGRP